MGALLISSAQAARQESDGGIPEYEPERSSTVELGGIPEHSSDEETPQASQSGPEGNRLPQDHVWIQDHVWMQYRTPFDAISQRCVTTEENLAYDPELRRRRRIP